MPTTGQDGRLSRLGRVLWAILQQRCPRCRRGPMFRGLFTMNDPCPVCGLVFQREEGYFLGAMYVSYVLASALLIPSYFLAAALFPSWGSMAVALVALVPYLPLTPIVFRYSRVLWIYFERGVCPDDVSAGVYEKVRQQRLAEHKGKPPPGGRAAPPP